MRATAHPCANLGLADEARDVHARASAFGPQPARHIAPVAGHVCGGDWPFVARRTQGAPTHTSHGQPTLLADLINTAKLPAHARAAQDVAAFALEKIQPRLVSFEEQARACGGTPCGSCQ